MLHPLLLTELERCDSCLVSCLNYAGRNETCTYFGTQGPNYEMQATCIPLISRQEANSLRTERLSPNWRSYASSTRKWPCPGKNLWTFLYAGNWVQDMEDWCWCCWCCYFRLYVDECQSRWSLGSLSFPSLSDVIQGDGSSSYVLTSSSGICCPVATNEANLETRRVSFQRRFPVGDGAETSRDLPPATSTVFLRDKYHR